MDKVDPVMNRDLTAAYLSLFPGMGHLYKHQFRTGLLIMVFGNLVIAVATAFLAIATLGAAIVVIPALWIGWAAWDAFDTPDLSHRRKTPAE
ncbi:MAG TPA: hypothetical protein VG796_24355 [Verrucomicrobiales bacterium]|jgi:hypothetical protein|nr:hypothetical protein [Verrucomicrobiales bacterium]